MAWAIGLVDALARRLRNGRFVKIRRSGSSVAIAMALVLLGLVLPCPGAEEEAFDAAARLYEQGKFREAAAVYDRLVTNGTTTVSVLFNQGNAWFKAGEKGRAIHCYRRAERLAPRDPAVTANLRWVRSKVPGFENLQPGLLRQFLGILTPNEWAVGGILSVWLWVVLMVTREFVAGIRAVTAPWSWVLGSVAAVLMTLAFAAGAHGRRVDAVVVAPEATVRFGPLEEAQTAFTAADGAELTVTDRKGSWVEVRDGVGRRGWIADRHLAWVP